MLNGPANALLQPLRSLHFMEGGAADSGRRSEAIYRFSPLESCKGPMLQCSCIFLLLTGAAQQNFKGRKFRDPPLRDEIG